MKLYLFLLILILLNSIILQKKVMNIKERFFYNFDINTSLKEKINNRSQDNIMSISKKKYNTFNKKINILNKNRKYKNKIINNKKKK